jgi:DNA-binding HxlR family transcriptional regulator
MKNSLKKRFGCPVQATVSMMSGKRKVQILWHLGIGERRFAELRELLPGVTEKVLTDQLRQLQASGVVSRTATRSVPPKVTYSLSRAGQELIPMLQDLCGWGTTHLGIAPTLPVRPKIHLVQRRRS